MPELVITLHVGGGEAWVVAWEPTLSGDWLPSKPLVATSQAGALAFLPPRATPTPCPPSFAQEAFVVMRELP